MAIEIKFLSNIVSFLRGTKDMGDALDDVGDSLDDVAKDAKKAGDKAGDGIADGAKDASRAVERLEDDFKSLARTASRTSDDAGDTMRRSMHDGADGAGEAVREFGDEAKQNIAETFSSFRGEAEDFAQIAQDTFGGVISALGPLGMVAGAAGALGIGLIMGKLEEGSEEAEEMRQRISDLAAEFIETGGVGQSSLEGIVERLKELASTTEEGAQNLASLREDAEGSVSGFKKIADAYAGQTDQLDTLIEKERERHEELRRIAKDPATSWWSQEDQAAASERRDAQERIVEGLEDAQEAAQGAADAEAAWLNSSGPALEARANQLDTLQGELDESVSAWSEFIDAETGAADPAAYIAAMQARLDATANFNGNVQQLAQTFGLSFEEQQALLDQGVDFAPMLSAIMAGGSDMQAEYVAQLRAMLDGGEAIVNDTELTAQVTTQADTGDAQQQLDQLTTDRDAPVTAEPDTKKAEQALDQLAKKKRIAPITARADTAAAELAMLAWQRRKRTIDVEVVARTREGVIVP